MGRRGHEWNMVHECDYVCVHVCCVCLQYMWQHVWVTVSSVCSVCSMCGWCMVVLVVYVCSMWVVCSGHSVSVYEWCVCVQCGRCVYVQCGGVWWWCICAVWWCVWGGVCAVWVVWCVCVCSVGAVVWSCVCSMWEMVLCGDVGVCAA